MINKRHNPPTIPPINAALLFSSGDSKEKGIKEKVRRVSPNAGYDGAYFIPVKQRHKNIHDKVDTI